MTDQKIGIVFGQEGRRPKNVVERFDSGHLFIAFGGLGSRSESNMKKDGNFFILDEKWKRAFVRGGKQKKRFCPRLVTGYSQASPAKQQVSVPGECAFSRLFQANRHERGFPAEIRDGTGGETRFRYYAGDG